MKFFATGLAVASAVAFVSAAPDGCKASWDGPFQATIVELSMAKRSLHERSTECGSGSQLMVTLKDGVLTDALGRTGYIASNYQFQFDAPPQAGTLMAEGFSVCANGSLALDDSATFYQCASGTFFNLYDRDWADQCSPILIEALPCSDIKTMPAHAKDLVVGTTMMHTTLVTVLEDGQPQVVPTEMPVPICQIEDGQVQGHTTPCADIPPPLVTGPGAPAPPPGSTPAPTEGPSSAASPPPAAGGSSSSSAAAGSSSSTSAPSPSSPDEESPSETAAASGNASPAVLALVVCLVAALAI